MKTVLDLVIDQHKSLGQKEAYEAMNGIMNREFPAEQVGKFLLALRSRGETVDEIFGFATSIREHARPLNIKREDLIDTCGTGGDGGKTFNISTAVALVVGSSGVGVAKHGNRSVSSQSGSADVYEALGFKIESDVAKISKSIDELGFGFLYAPHFHPAMNAVAPIRKSLGVRTVFNILGPLLNPAKVQRQVIGVYDKKVIEKMAQVLIKLGVKEALIINSEDGLDEISISARTSGLHLKDSQIVPFSITPQEAGLKRAPLSKVMGGSATENAIIIENIFTGVRDENRDVVVLNSGAALWIAGLAKDIKSGVILAQDLLDKNKVSDFLTLLRKNQ